MLEAEWRICSSDISLPAADMSSFGDHKVFQLIDGRPIPDWKKFLGVNANKQALLKFLGDFVIRSHSQSSIVTSSDDELYLAGLFSVAALGKHCC
jgi:hypothetical protein